jgi:DUF2075 family protein
MAHLYSATVADFIAQSSEIAEILQDSFLSNFGFSPNPKEFTSWSNSLPVLAKVIDQPKFHTAHIFLEFKMPLASSRCDVIIVGKDKTEKPHAVVIELKQWQIVQPSAHRDQVSINSNNHNHPSAQVRGYCNFLKYYYKAFTEYGIQISGCAFLHNMTDKRSINLIQEASVYGTLSREYPVYFAKDEEAFVSYLGGKVGFGGDVMAVSDITSAEVAPSTKLLDVVDQAIQGKFEWQLLDSQLAVFNTIVSKVEQAKLSGKKFVIIVRGAPGSGKSVLAIQLLAYAARQHWRIAHATGSKAFMTVLQAKTADTADRLLRETYKVTKKRDLPVEKMFSTFKNIADVGTTKENDFDLVVGDESHRLWDFRRDKRKGNLQLSTTPMVEEITRASLVTAFFIDDNQSVRAYEIGRSSYIEESADKLGIAYEVIDLDIQFRCAGSESYIDWLNYVFGYGDLRSLAWQEFDDYEFKIVTSMKEMQARLDELREEGNRCRMLAGFCWKWSLPNANDTLVYDIIDHRFGTWSAPWIEKGDQYAKPKDSRYFKWATDDDYYSQVGSIYSVQGFEFDYIGVIFGEDLLWRKDNWQGDIKKSKDHVFKRELKGADVTEQLRNIYRVLLTRGMKGTFVFFLDDETRKRFEEAME